MFGLLLRITINTYSAESKISKSTKVNILSDTNKKLRIVHLLARRRTGLNVLDDPREGFPSELVLEADGTAAALLLGLHPVDVTDADVIFDRSGRPLRSRVANGPLRVIVLGQEIYLGLDLVEVDLIDVLNLEGSVATGGHLPGSVGPSLNHEVGLEGRRHEVCVQVLAKRGILGEAGKKIAAKRPEIRAKALKLEAPINQFWQKHVNCTEVAFGLLTQRPQFQILARLRFFLYCLVCGQ